MSEVPIDSNSLTYYVSPRVLPGGLAGFAKVPESFDSLSSLISNVSNTR